MTLLVVVQRDNAESDELRGRNPWRSIGATPAGAGASFWANPIAPRALSGAIVWSPFRSCGVRRV
jgi:hypothetical protein